MDYSIYTNLAYEGSGTSKPHPHLLLTPLPLLASPILPSTVSTVFPCRGLVYQLITDVLGFSIPFLVDGECIYPTPWPYLLPGISIFVPDLWNFT